MRRFTFILMAAFIAVTSFAQTGLKISDRSLKETQPKNAKRMLSLREQLTLRKAPRKAAADFPVITEAPEGEVKVYKRSGDCTYVNGGYAYQGTQSGAISMVFAGNDVYIYEPICGYTTESWVKGTLSEDKKTITVPLGQNLYYSSNYDAGIQMWFGNNGESVTPNRTITEVTYTIDGNTITLNGASEDLILSCFWTDDNSWTGYSEWNSVYTEVKEDLTLVTPPAELKTQDMPVEGIVVSWDEEGDAQQSPFQFVTKVGFDGSDVYMFFTLGESLPSAWVKGTLEDGVVVFEPQFIGYDEANNKYFLAGYEEDNNTLLPFEMIYDEARGTFELDGLITINADGIMFSMDGLYAYLSSMYIGTRPEVVTPPEGLVTVEKDCEGFIYTDEEEEFTGPVVVGIDGTDVYFQNLIPEVPDGWVKGTLTDNIVTIPCGQYVGVHAEYGTSVYVVGDDPYADEEDYDEEYDGDEEEETELDNVYFRYNAEKGQFELLNNLYVNGKSNDLYFYSVIEAGLLIGISADATWVAAEQGFENSQVIEGITISETLVGVLAQGTGTSAPAFYTTGNALRTYSGNTLTLTSTAEPIGKVIFYVTAPRSGKDDNQMEASTGTVEATSDTKLVWTGAANEVTFTIPGKGLQTRIVKMDVYYVDYSTVTPELPAALITEAYLLKGTDTYYEEETTYEVQVGFDGNDVYFLGLSQYCPDAWVKGTLVDGVVTIPGWYLGVYESFFGDVELAFSGATMQYDAATSTFTCAEFQSVGESGSSWDEMADVTITKLVEKAAIPADPSVVGFEVYGAKYPYVEFNIPTVDTEGEYMVLSKLSYEVLIEKDGVVSTLTATPDLYIALEESMSEFPYTFTDEYDIDRGGETFCLNQPVEEILSWSKIGVRSIYRGLDEENYSNIGWYDIKEYVRDYETGISATSKTEGAVTYYDLQGRVANANAKGILIKQVRQADGKVSRTKVLR